MFALTVDLTNHIYISMQEVDGSGNIIGVPEYIYPYHLKGMGIISDPKYGQCIALNKSGGSSFGVSTGNKLSCDYLIPVSQLYSYNNTTTFVNVSPPPPYTVIYADIHSCIKSEEGA